MAKQYTNKGFEDKIKINLARIMSSENDKFSFIRAEYVRDFPCELCGHQHLSMCYWVKNQTTGIIIKVGCECLEHFRLPQSDIDKADALRKMMERSIEGGRDLKVREFGTKLYDELPEEMRKIGRFLQSDLRAIVGEEAYESLPKSTKKLYRLNRDDMIEVLGNEHFKRLPREEKYNLIYSFYNLNYAERILDEVAKGEYHLSKEEVADIAASMENGADRIAAAEAKAKAKAERDALIKLQNARRAEISALESEMYRVSDAARKSLTDLDPAVIADWHARATPIGIDSRVEQMVKSTAEAIVREKAFRAEYGWIINYTGTNSFLLDLQQKIVWYRSLTPAQIEAGKKALNDELNPAPVVAATEDAGFMLDKLIAKFPANTFYRGLAAQWRRSHSLSPKQMDCVLKDFANKL